MAVYEYVARNLNDYPLGRSFTTGHAYADIVGGDTALDTADGDVSFVHWYRDAAGTPADNKTATFKFVPVGSPAPGSPDQWTAVITYSGRMSAIPGVGGIPSVILATPTATRIVGTLDVAQGVEGDPYLTATSEAYGPDFDGLNDPATFALLSRLGGAGTATDMWLSQLRLRITTGQPFERRWPRDDGLGVNPGRAWGGTSAQKSGRRWGYR